jgi:CDP-diacylglycerol---serine O-phosphatidyltransferase
MNRGFEARYVIPNTVTAANIVAGFCAILAAIEGRFELAVYLLVVAILLDLCDGRVARALRATSKFGQEMDSFSDTVSFCVAPAVLAYLAVLKPLGPSGIAVAAIYLLAGVLRLARFNLLSDEHKKHHETLGVPTPIGAGYLMVLALLRDQIPPLAAALVVLTMAVLLVSTWRLPELRAKGVVGAMMALGFCNYLAVVAHPSWLTVAWWNVWNLVILIAAKALERDAELEDEAPTSATL